METVRELLALRHRDPELRADADFSVLHAVSGDPLFVFSRGSRIVAVNPSGASRSAKLPQAEARKPLFRIGGCALEGENLTLEAQSFAVLSQ